MNYKKIYDSIILYRKNNVILTSYEKHHIVPKSFGGSDCSTNIVRLTSREHFLCHYLLVKLSIPNTRQWYKANHAFMMMKSTSKNQNRYFNSRLYAACRENFSTSMKEAQTGEKNSQYGKMWITDGKHNKTIKAIDDIPIGWYKGRIMKSYSTPSNITNVMKPPPTKNKSIIKQPTKNKSIINLCKKCGQHTCERPNVCSRHQLINTFVKYFNFDITTIGSTKIYNEFDRVVKILYSDYHDKKLSLNEMAEKYNFSSNERVRKMLDTLGIPRRTLSESLKNFNSR